MTATSAPRTVTHLPPTVTLYDDARIDARIVELGGPATVSVQMLTADSERVAGLFLTPDAAAMLRDSLLALSLPCLVCNGNGTVEVLPPNGDPQRAVDEPCPNEWCDGGEVRT